MATPGTPDRIDEIHSAYSVRLGADAEHVVLTGGGAANVWDNAGDNVLYGNAGANVFYPQGGSDSVEGGGGYDVLVLSGAAVDYRIDVADGRALIVHQTSGDTVQVWGVQGVSFSGPALDPVHALYEAYTGVAPSAEDYAAAGSLLKQGMALDAFAARLAATPQAQAHVAQGSDADFVETVYQAVLGRAADAEGLAWWTAQLAQGTARAELPLRFAQSDEFQDVFKPLFATDHVDIAGLYRAALGRDPDESGFAYWSARSAEGATLGEIVGSFVASDEFQARAADLEAPTMVRSLYVDLLDREPEQGGFSYWMGELANGAGYAGLIRQFVESAEFRGNVDQLLERGDWVDFA